MLANAPHPNASKVFLNWLLSRDGQMAFQKLTKENSLRVDIPKEGIVDPELMLHPHPPYSPTPTPPPTHPTTPPLPSPPPPPHPPPPPPPPPTPPPLPPPPPHP